MRLFHPPLGLSIFYGSRDQLRPGSLLHKRKEPGNEVVSPPPSIIYDTTLDFLSPKTIFHLSTLSVVWSFSVETPPTDEILKKGPGFCCVPKWLITCTHAKSIHLVASLRTRRQQVVFALLVPSLAPTTCPRLLLLTTCNKLVDIIRLVARLFQEVQYSHDITILLQPCVVNLVKFLFIMTVSDLLEQPCDKSDNAIKLVTNS